MPADNLSNPLADLRRDGFLTFKNVFDPAVITDWRTRFLARPECLERGSLPDLYRVFPDLAPFIFSQKAVESVRSLLGPTAICLTEPMLHCNRFIDWHKDTTEQEIGGIRSHSGDRSLLLQAAVYFQKNGPDGGGLTVLPGTHFEADRFLEFYQKGLVSRAVGRLKKSLGLSVFQQIERQKRALDLPTEPGDLLLFDVRLDHRSTFRRGPNGSPQTPDGPAKFAIFNTFGTPGPLLDEYRAFMQKRPESYYEFMRKTAPAPAILACSERLNFPLIH